MSDLIAVGFKGEHTADQVLNKLQALQKEYLIDLEDACVVVRDQAGQVHLKQSLNLTRVGAAAGGIRGAMWGTLIGLLFLNPLIGLAAGAAVGASRPAAMCWRPPAWPAASTSRSRRRPPTTRAGSSGPTSSSACPAAACS